MWTDERGRIHRDGDGPSDSGNGSNSTRRHSSSRSQRSRPPSPIATEATTPSSVISGWTLFWFMYGKRIGIIAIIIVVIAGGVIGYLSLGDYEKSVLPYTISGFINASNTESLIARGDINARYNKYEAAISDYTRAIGIKPDADVFQKRAGLYLIEKKYDLALDDYANALKLNPEIADSIKNTAIDYAAMAEYDNAIILYNVLINYDETNTGLLAGRGDVYFEKGAYPRALTDYNQALRIKPDADVLKKRADLYLAEKKYDLAFDDYDNALKLNPETADSIKNTAIDYAAKAEYDNAAALFSVLIKNDETNADLLMSRGNIYFEKGVYPQALTDYNQALVLDVNDMGNRLRIKADTCFDKYEYPKAIIIYEKLLEFKKDDADLLIKCAAAYVETGAFGEASDKCLAAVQLDHDSVNTLIKTADNLGYNNKALFFYDIVIENEPLNLTGLKKRADVYFANKNYDLALRDYSAVIEIMPNSGDSLLKRAGIFMDEKNYEAAIADYTIVINEIDNDKVFLSRGEAYLAAAQYQPAADDFFQALNINSGNKYFLMEQADYCLKSKDKPAESLVYYDAVLKKYPNDAEVLIKRGDVFLLLQNNNAAIQDYEDALKQNPNDISVLEKLGELSYKEKRYNYALSYYSKIIDLQKEQNGDSLLKRGMVYFALDEYDRAITDFSAILKNKTLLSSYKNIDAVYRWRGDAYFAKTKYGDAIKDYGSAIKIKNDSAVYYSKRGFVYYKSALGKILPGGDYKKAAEDLSQAILIEPDNADYYNMRADVYYEQKDYSRALRDYDEALKLSPGLYQTISPKRQDCLKELEGKD